MKRKTQSYGKLILGFTFLILGTRLGWVFIFGGDIPIYDQWRFEGITIYQQIESEGFTWDLLFTPNNEHRVFWTASANLLIYAFSGWDSLAQQGVSAVLASLCFAFVAIQVVSSLRGSPSFMVGLLLLLSLLFILPLDWANMLWGFQTSFYFLVLFAVIHLTWVQTAKAFNWKWILGWVMGAFGLVNLGTGFFAATASVLISLFLGRKIGQKPFLRVANVGLGLVLTGVGFLIFPDLPDNYFVREVATPGSFLMTCLSGAAWPFYMLPFLAPWVWLPGMLFGWYALMKKDSDLKAIEILCLGLALWVLAMCVALGVTRHNTFSSRYFGILSLTVLVNGVFLTGLWLRYSRWRIPIGMHVLRPVSALWIGSILSGLFFLGVKHATHEMPNFREGQFSGWVATSEYLQRGVWTHEDEQHAVKTVLPHPNGVVPVLDMDWMKEKGPHSLRMDYLKSLDLTYPEKLRRIHHNDVNFMLILGPWPEELLSRFFRILIFCFPLYLLVGILLLFPLWKAILFLPDWNSVFSGKSVRKAD